MDRNLTILVAEDNPDDAFFFERALRKAGLANPVQILADGVDVVRYLKGEGAYHDRREFPLPGLLFIDLHMPRVSGFEVLKWLRDQPQCRNLPILVFSGSEDPEDVVRAYQLGATAYFRKPATTASLAGILRAASDFWTRAAKPASESLLCL